jgi:hypothetical protein
MKKIVISVLSVLLLLTAFVATHHYSKEAGMLEGIEAYHEQCYNIGGYIIGPDGKVVVCKGQGQVPKEELPNFKSTI